jgi:hypothetical protein
MPIMTRSLQQQQCPRFMPTMGIIHEPTGKQKQKHKIAGHRLMSIGFPRFMNSVRRPYRRHVIEWVDTGTGVRRNLQNMKSREPCNAQGDKS